MTSPLWKHGDILTPATLSQVGEAFEWIADKVQADADWRRLSHEQPRHRELRADKRSPTSIEGEEQ